MADWHFDPGRIRRCGPDQHLRTIGAQAVALTEILGEELACVG